MKTLFAFAVLAALVAPVRADDKPAAAGNGDMKNEQQQYHQDMKQDNETFHKEMKEKREAHRKEMKEKRKAHREKMKQMKQEKKAEQKTEPAPNGVPGQ
jgi:hypothetical protein